MTPDSSFELPGPARLEPLTKADYLDLWRRVDPDTSNVPGADLHISRTWAHSPGLAIAQAPLQRHLMSGLPLSARLREIAVLRIGWRCSAPYEVSQHARFGRDAGLTDEKIARLMQEDVGGDWDETDLMIVRVTDELYAHHAVSDETWEQMTTLLDTAQCVELLAVVGRYWTVSVVTNSLRIQLEPGVRPLAVDGAPRTYGRP